MSFIVNINKDSDRIFLVELNKHEIRCKIVWQKLDEYCLDTISYEDYSEAKKIQIRLDKFHNEIPVV